MNLRLSASCSGSHADPVFFVCFFWLHLFLCAHSQSQHVWVRTSAILDGSDLFFTIINYKWSLGVRVCAGGLLLCSPLMKLRMKNSFRNDGNLLYVKCSKYCMCCEESCRGTGQWVLSWGDGSTPVFLQNIPRALFVWRVWALKQGQNEGWILLQ